MLKLNVCLLEEAIGFVLLDIRDIQLRITNKTFKVNSLMGAELTLSASLNSPLSIVESNDNMSNIALQDHSHLVEDDERDNEEEDERYNFSVSLEDFTGIKEYCQSVFPDTTPSANFWFSWTLFDRVFQSIPFTAHNLNEPPSRSRDVIKVKSSPAKLLSTLQSIFPLRLLPLY